MRTLRLRLRALRHVPRCRPACRAPARRRRRAGRRRPGHHLGSRSSRWIVRLEDQRILRDPNPPPPVVLQPATQREPASSRPAAVRSDPAARRPRGARAPPGRAGARPRRALPRACEPLIAAARRTSEVEVRQMAAFALGLIGDALGARRRCCRRSRTEPMLQGRAAEALGLIGDAPMPTPSARWCRRTSRPAR